MKKVVVLASVLGALFANSIDKNVLYEGARVLEVSKKSDRIDEFNDIVYKQVKTRDSVKELHLSILAPQNDTLKPAIIFYTGGGFQSASYHRFIQMRMALAEAGFVVVSAQYRVIPDTFPALIEDAKAAIRYVKAHAKEYGIDSKRIGILGDSAGGYVAQMMGLAKDKKYDVGENLNQNSQVQAVATLYGISNLLSIGEGFSKEVQEVHKSKAVTEALMLNGVAFKDFSGAAIDADEKKALAASPLGNLDGKKPPFLIMHGDSDTLVSPMQSKRLYVALRAKKIPVDYVVVKNAEHADDLWYQQVVFDEVIRFFKQNLTKK
ncbi:alpha/beta hydrolase fold domain-containing protein [Campylobacter sp. VTCC 70190]|uniref:alpha/beta hydrolase fold domain-containing protein n=1 Tax=Campylobacter sp. VTCC 70190 TaxID=3392118 RepID=UPI00398E337F